MFLWDRLCPSCRFHLWDPWFLFHLWDPLYLWFL